MLSVPVFRRLNLRAVLKDLGGSVRLMELSPEGKILLNNKTYPWPWAMMPQNLNCRIVVTLAIQRIGAAGRSTLLGQTPAW